MEPIELDDPNRASRTRRRLAIGGLAVAMLVGSAVTVNAVASADADPNPPTSAATSDATTTAPADTTPEANPAPGSDEPVSTSAGAQDEWVTIPLDDPHLDPDQVLEQLQAAGITARSVAEGSDPFGGTAMTADGGVSASTEAGIGMQKDEDVPAGTITQIYAEWDEPEGVSDPDSGQGEGEGADLAPTPESIAAQEAYGEAVGVRLDDAAHTLSIRRDAKYPVLLFVTQ